MSVPYVRWWVDRWIGGTYMLTRVQRGAYHDLLMAQAALHRPLTEADIKSILGSDYETVWPVIREKFICRDDGAFENAKLSEEIHRVVEYSKSRSCNRKAGKHIHKKHMLNICKSYVRHMGSGSGSGSGSRSGSRSGSGSSLASKGDRIGKGVEWRESYSIYAEDHDKAVAGLLADDAWMADMARLNPGVDLRLTIEKASRYWRSEAGWKKCKGRKSKDLNWRQCYENALTNKMNRVYVQSPQRQYGPRTPTVEELQEIYTARLAP